MIDVSDILDRLAKLPLEIERVGSICRYGPDPECVEVAGLVCQAQVLLVPLLHESRVSAFLVLESA